MRTHHFALPLPLILALAVASPSVAYADGQTLQLGSISVTGDQKIMETLRSIKQALRAPYTDDPAHADDVVCRIEKQLGEAREYLDCATNRTYSRRRDATQTAVAIGTLGIPGGGDPLRSFVSLQPEQRLRVPVNGAGLQAVLEKIPDAAPAVPTTPTPVPAAGTRAAPAAATGPGTWQW